MIIDYVALYVGILNYSVCTCFNKGISYFFTCICVTVYCFADDEAICEMSTETVKPKLTQRKKESVKYTTTVKGEIVEYLVDVFV